MSYHSSALPTQAAAMIWTAPAGFDTPALDSAVRGGTAIGHSVPVARFRSHSGTARAQLSQVPEQAGHDPCGLAGEGGEQVLVGPVLRAGRVGMRHPDRGHADDVGEHVV